MSILINTHTHTHTHAHTHAHKKFRGAQEKSAMTFVECLGVLLEDTMEGPLWRETLGMSLGSYDAEELVAGMRNSNGCRQETNHPPPRHILHKDGMELSHSQSGAPPGSGSIPSREKSPVCC